VPLANGTTGSASTPPLGDADRACLDSLIAKAVDWLDVQCGLELARFDAHTFSAWDDMTDTSHEQLDVFQVHRRAEPGRPRLLPANG
jgi:hypothetical protein